MALTKAFYDAVQSGNIRRVRIMMQDSLLVDPSFAEFEAMEKVAASMAGLYDEHDGKGFVEDKNLWNDDYMDKLMVKSLSNFSHERVEHLKKVVRYLRPVAKKSIPSKEEARHHHNYASQVNNSYREEKQKCQERGDFLGAKIGIGAVVGAAAASTIASVAGASVGGVVCSIAAGAAIGGVATSFIVNGGKNKHE